MDEDDNIRSLQNYRDAFGEEFPNMAFSGTPQELDVVIAEAIASGVPWNERTLSVRMGGEDPGPDAQF